MTKCSEVWKAESIPFLFFVKIERVDVILYSFRGVVSDSVGSYKMWTFSSSEFEHFSFKGDRYVPCSQKCEFDALKQLLLSSFSTHFQLLKMSGISHFNSDLFSHVNLVITILINAVFTSVVWDALKRENF